MSRLVGDLMLLAKAERPDFLQTSVVDVGDLTDRVFDLARGLGDRNWQLDARASGTVLADPRRLTQALMQLAANAVRYTEDGHTVAVGSQLDTDTVSLWVRDNGPGIEAAEARRIFDRFARGSGAPSGRRLRLGPVHRLRDREGPRRHGHRGLRVRKGCDVHRRGPPLPRGSPYRVPRPRVSERRSVREFS